MRKNWAISKAGKSWNLIGHWRKSNFKGKFWKEQPKTGMDNIDFIDKFLSNLEFTYLKTTKTLGNS